MIKKIIVFFTCVLTSTSMIIPINLQQYKAQIVTGRNQLITAIQGLKAAKLEISKLYSDQLKPQLIDPLDTRIHDTNNKISEINDSLSDLTRMPDFIRKIVNIGDLVPTLQWIINNPLAKINQILTSTKNIFQPVTDELVLPNPKAQALYGKFDLSIAKLQSAVCKIEKTLTAIKADFTPSTECAPKQ